MFHLFELVQFIAGVGDEVSQRHPSLSRMTATLLTSPGGFVANLCFHAQPRLLEFTKLLKWASALEFVTGPPLVVGFGVASPANFPFFHLFPSYRPHPTCEDAFDVCFFLTVHYHLFRHCQAIARGESVLTAGVRLEAVTGVTVMTSMADLARCDCLRAADLVKKIWSL
ncbi:hypothetical protein CYMTET_5933 [Cymbomonas tetramitiformis]|uniref:Uncharacterized protein n=1 Tax=Cymbomonas tetramitiformis TaxID=36881 RepID=A0AAE0GY89_9CHLO|nr:hypothetical protein CYMTET_5933 [Cymbomonas tetramitiformis]